MTTVVMMAALSSVGGGGGDRGRGRGGGGGRDQPPRHFQQMPKDYQGRKASKREREREGRI